MLCIDEMKRKILKAVRTVAEFEPALFEDLDLGVELQDFTEPTLPDLVVYKTLADYEKKFCHFNGLKSMHGSFLDVDIASFNLDLASYSKKLYLRDMFFAKILNMDYLIFHGNIRTRYANEVAWNFFLKLQSEFFAEALEVVDFAGVVVLENVLDSSPDLLLNLIEAINLPQVKMNFDFGHAKLSMTPIETWICKSKDVLRYVHLHSNNGKDDCHKPVTPEDAKKLTKILDKNGLSVPISLEYWGCDLIKEVERLNDLL